MAKGDGDGAHAAAQAIGRAKATHPSVLAMDGADPADEVVGRDDRI